MGRQTTTSKAKPKPQTGTNLATKQSVTALYVTLSTVYLVEALFLPADAKAIARYQISATAIKIVSLVVILPLIAIWGVGFYGYYRYNSYVETIKKTHDGKFHQLIANGLFVLALSLPINSILSNLLSYLGRQYPNFKPGSMIIVNYVNIAMYLAAFALIYMGINGLLQVNSSTLRQRSEIYLMMAYTVIVGVFIYISLHNPARQFATSQTSTAAYYLPDWLIVLTIIVPYAVTWYLGMISAYRFLLYRSKVKGQLYRQAFTLVASGIATVVGLLMVLRYLTTLITVLDKLTLKYLLLIIYVLMMVIAVGYIFIALGAKRLKRIEEV
jgi:hypothetical protein